MSVWVSRLCRPRSATAITKIVSKNTLTASLIVRSYSESLKSVPAPKSCSKALISFNETFSPKDSEAFLGDMLVFEDFISPEEESSLLNEVEPHMQRLRYETDHWDDAIHGYRETERSHWNKTNSLILDRVRQAAFPPGKPQLKLVHVLDLSEDGYIKPHIDSIKFCGDTIAGLSLLSSSVMRMVHDKQKEKLADIFLKQRSLYIMKGSARYDFTHEILSKNSSTFKGEKVARGRRISVICRSEV